MRTDSESKDMKRGQDCQWQISKQTFLSVLQPFWLKASCRVIFREGPASIQNEGFLSAKKPSVFWKACLRRAGVSSSASVRFMVPVR